MNLPYRDFKVEHFPAFKEGCKGKAVGFLAKCCCEASTQYEHTGLSHSAGPESSPLEGNDLLVQILPLV